ncbi:hypothetical protein BOW28_06970 [Solemya velum gill symbiont]|uniref:ubiquinone biosynthesis accessory factor UbiJ n=1 Tax=Solemya velum gill symbiont TaxID=2340 RepID=UPI000998C7C6|nr:SCP2 sterol-binding domain-containing protein [Solemya velum gill symbiont]OOZ17186.1 hypothetical protein BOW28_06970 [Solemya velum gill symbiont]OOZ26828.1 hypothetical protein BOW32_06705 [Solemya velum gill symbiont]
MEVSNTLLVGLESAVNQVLEKDQVTRERLAKLHGRRIAIELVGWVTLHCVPDGRGALQIFSAPVEEAEAVISATPFNFAETAMADRREDQVFKGKIRLRGDIHLAEAFSNILADFDFDWEEALSKIAGDLVAHQLGNNLRGVAKWAWRGRRHLNAALGEYLTEEAQLLPIAFEVDEWRDAVDETRDAVERLQARIDLLASKIKQGGTA